MDESLEPHTQVFVLSSVVRIVLLAAYVHCSKINKGILLALIKLTTRALEGQQLENPQNRKGFAGEGHWQFFPTYFL